MKKIILISFFLFAQTVSAQVFISEIKYTGSEWVEISNGGALVDLSLWKFFEGGTNHKLKPIQGGTTIAPGAYAIIANDSTAFLNEYSGFRGVLFDSSFSLLDAGEEISIKSSDINIVDTVSYTGVKGSKNSTQKISGMWDEATPTPGVENLNISNVSIQTTQNLTPIHTNTTPNNTTFFSAEPQILADAGATTRIVPTGASIIFNGRAFGLKNEPIENARLVWSFGDGAYAEGTSVTHTYYYPGEYVVVLDAASGHYSASDRVTVRVTAPLLALHTGGDTARSFVAIENRGEDEIDLSLWQIVSGGKTFIFPENTILGARKSVTFASEVTELTTPIGSVAFINFQNGTRVEMQHTVNVTPVTLQTPSISSIKTKTQTRTASPPSQHQEASVLDAFSDTQSPLPAPQDGGLWPWYVGAAFLGALALLGLRLTRENEAGNTITADDFEIIEETDDEMPH